jgi:hypothetical protein
MAFLTLRISGSDDFRSTSEDSLKEGESNTKLAVRIFVGISEAWYSPAGI